MVEETMSNVSGVLVGMVHKNNGYLKSRGSHDGGIDRPVVNQPTQTGRVFFFSGMWELLSKRCKCLAGKVPDAVRNLVRRADDRRKKVFAPPL